MKFSQLNQFLFNPKPHKIRPTKDTQALGKWGEDWTLWKYVKDRKATLIDRNWVGGSGEIDLIFKEEDFIVFCEVKTRSISNLNPIGHVAVRNQRQHLQSAAREYYHQLPSLRPLPRFDLMIVQYHPESESMPEFLNFVNTMETVNLR